MSTDPQANHPSSSSWILVVLAWLGVGIPLLWGVWTTLGKAALLFR